MISFRLLNGFIVNRLAKHDKVVRTSRFCHSWQTYFISLQDDIIQRIALFSRLSFFIPFFRCKALLCSVKSVRCGHRTLYRA